jgi:hypothetical protein
MNVRAGCMEALNVISRLYCTLVDTMRLIPWSMNVPYTNAELLPLHAAHQMLIHEYH